MKATDYVYPIEETQETQRSNLGIDLRTYLAGMAMQGLMSTDFLKNDSFGNAAKECIYMADALIEELNKTS